MNQRLLLKRGWITCDVKDVDAWARRHGLEVFSYPCQECGRDLTANVPFWFKTKIGIAHGLTAPGCDCGSDSTPPHCMLLSHFTSR